MRAKQVVAMGGAINVPGNITPLAEFNVYADSIAAARVFALSSPIPASTMPPTVLEDGTLPPYPPSSTVGSKRLNVVLFPLDTTDQHPIKRKSYQDFMSSLVAQGSPLAEWHAAFMTATFGTAEKLHHGGDLVLHDPLCIWYALDSAKRGIIEREASMPDHGAKDAAASGPAAKSGWTVTTEMDIRIETVGQWSRGACVVDRRDRRKQTEGEMEAQGLGERRGDAGAWLSDKRGNRIRICTGTPGGRVWLEVLLGTIFPGVKGELRS